MAKSERLPPSELTEEWPNTVSPDIAGETARQLAVNLRRSIGDASIRSIADIAGLDEGTIRKLLAGTRWPDLRTIVLLEQAVGTQLWPASFSDGADR